MSKKVTPRWVEGQFGFSLDLEELPDDCDMVMLQVMGQHQLDPPYKVCMPHQVYRHDIEAKGGEVYITPFKAKERVCIQLKTGDKYDA